MEKCDLKEYSNIRVAKDNKGYYETDGLVISRLFIDHYNVFPNVFTLCESYEIKKNRFKKSYFTLESTLEAFEKNNIKFSVRSVNCMDCNGNLSDRHYAIFLDDFPCIISVDETSRSYDRDGEYYTTYVYDVYYKTYDDNVKKVVNLIWKNSFHVEDIEISKQINFVTTTNGGYTLISKEIKLNNVDVQRNYNDDFEKVDKITNDFIDGDDSGLIIFNGEPGTGKSYYIKNLINTHNKQFVFVTQDIANQMACPEFINFLMTLEDSVLILEDCENIVSSRNQGNNSSAISNILNICDGILSDVLNIKIIVTFNTDLKNVDSALLRKGRLKYQYTFDKLSLEKTKALLKELYGDDYDVSDVKPMTLAEIYNLESNGSNSNSKKKIGFA